MRQLTRAEYKDKFLSRDITESKRSTITILTETKNKLRQLCTAVDGPRLPTGSLVEKIINEHCSIHSETIKELYKEDIPVY